MFATGGPCRFPNRIRLCYYQKRRFASGLVIEVAMLLPEKDVLERLESPSNLLNRLRSSLNPRGSAADKIHIPSLPPTADEVISNLEEKITTGGLKSKAAAIMSSAMDELKVRMPEIHKPERLATIAASMGKVISEIESKQSPVDDNHAKIIIYAPQIVNEETFNVIDISDQ